MLHDRLRKQINQLAGRRPFNTSKYILAPGVALAMALLAGCGGGGGGGGGGGVTGPTVTVQGQVTDNFVNPGAPVDGVSVTLQGTGDRTVTADSGQNGDGWYSLANVPANSTVTLVFNDPTTNETDDVQVTTTAATPQTQNVSYQFLLSAPP